MSKLIKIIFIILSILMSSEAYTAENSFDACINQLKRNALNKNVSYEYLDKLFTNIKFDPEVISKDRKQPEKILSFSEYSNIFLKEEHINNALQALKDNRELFNKIKNYSIEPELLVSLWSIETRLGKIKGNFNVLRSLSTLSCDTRRPEFFRHELYSLINLIINNRLTVNNPVGSWAGAMGHLQFLPSVIEKYGVDINHDNKIEIFEVSEELFATAAIFLTASGWKSGKSWGYLYSNNGNICDDSVDNYSVQNSNEYIRQITLDESSCMKVFVTRNYEALLKWNYSHYFVTTVGLLFEELISRAKEF